MPQDRRPAHRLKRATTNQERALGLAKGLVWPAFLVYALLVFLEKK